MDDTIPTVARGDRLTLGDVGKRYRRHLEAQGQYRLPPNRGRTWSRG
jgi:hypothetical protein